LVESWHGFPEGAKASGMQIESDASKSRRNAQRRGISFADAMELLSGPHVMRDDVRQDYGERRVVGYGLIGGRIHVCVYTLRGDAYRIISLRKANRRQIDAHGPLILR
jgi:uncharacterized DUF497 family protein